MFAFELVRQAVLNFCVEETDAIANALEFFEMEPIGHAVTRFNGRGEHMLKAGFSQFHLMPMSTLNNLEHLTRHVFEMSAKSDGIFQLIWEFGTRLQ